MAAMGIFEHHGSNQNATLDILSIWKSMLDQNMNSIDIMSFQNEET